jgi:hypothetical protein
MNIFVLDRDPKLAAQMHCDKHVVKMILESAQLLSTAHRLLDGELYEGQTKTGRKVKRWWLHDERELYLYQATHINHPCAVWARESETNYSWLYSLFVELSKEYTHRYGKVHKCMTMNPLLRISPTNIKSTGSMTAFPLAMPDDCKTEDVVESYRNYYKKNKVAIARWSKRPAPTWWSKTLQVG